MAVWLYLNENNVVVKELFRLFMGPRLSSGRSGNSEKRKMFSHREHRFPTSESMKRFWADLHYKRTKLTGLAGLTHVGPLGGAYSWETEFVEASQRCHSRNVIGSVTRSLH